MRFFISLTKIHHINVIFISSLIKNLLINEINISIVGEKYRELKYNFYKITKEWKK